jgi:lysozyme
VTDTSLYAVLAEQLLLGVAALAALIQSSKDERRRLAKLEKRDENLGKEFVPRLELEKSFKSIEKETAHTHTLVQALIYAGGDRQLAIQAIEAAAAAAPLMEYSEAGIELTKSFERLELEAYQDPTGTWTIGWGHTGKEVYAGVKIDAETSEVLLHADLSSAVACVNRVVKVALSQNQFDALVDFCFNIGEGDFNESKCTLLRDVNAGKFPAATMQFGLWIHSKGIVLPGLVRRRKAEAQLFAEAA